MFKENVVNVFNQRSIAREIGVSFETINRIFNRKQKCSKTIAYCICKVINPNAEIEDYFEMYKKGE
jgi:DNA-binding XRE family transcriptional regulator